MTERYILTIDIGTSSTRALLFDQHGNAVEGVAAHQAAQLQTAADGRAEMQTQQVLDAVAHCIDQVLTLAGPHAQRIVAVAIDTLVSNIVAVDANGAALTPLIIYADTRNADDAAMLRRQLVERDVHERTGCMLRTSYWPARLAWLRRTQPAVWQAAARFMTLGELLETTFFGQGRVSTSAASWSGLLDRHTLQWDTGLCDTLGVTTQQLGELVDSSTACHGLREPWRSRWSALATIPWFPAIGDGAAANIGSGCVDAQTLALTIGTTGALRVVRQHVPTVPVGLWCYRIDARRALLGGATSEGGNVHAWLHHTLQLADDEQALASIAPDSHGLTVLPLFAGERSPGWAGDAHATISGLTLSTTPQQIARASLEAVAYRFALIARSLIRPGDTPKIIASGGALLRSPLWMQICADVLGIPVTASAEPEATGRGAALLALEALGVLTDLRAAPVQHGSIYQPDATHHAVYQAAITRQEWLYQQLITP